MTIDEAINLFREDIDNPGSVDIMDLNRAEELGIEALNFYLREWKANTSGIWQQLPGETRE